MKERLQNRWAKIGLAGALAVGGIGATPEVVYSASPEATPLVEQAPEKEKLDVSAFMEYVGKFVKTDRNPQFFNQMERRASHNSDKFFQNIEIPGGFVQIYYPKGLGTEAKVGYLHTVTNGVGNDRNGVPAGLNFFRTDDEIKMQLGEDGELESSSGVNLFNFEDLETAAVENFREPLILRDIPWERRPMGFGTPALTLKEYKDENKHLIFGATQNGFLVLSRETTEIPIIGTDQVPTN